VLGFLYKRWSLDGPQGSVETSSPPASKATKLTSQSFLGVNAPVTS
jgi:hypothetical protein